MIWVTIVAQNESKSSSDPGARLKVDQIRTEKIFHQTNWSQMELKTIDAPIIVSTRTGLSISFPNHQWLLEEEIVDRISCLEQDSKCIGNSSAKYEFISKTKWRKEILVMVSYVSYLSC